MENDGISPSDVINEPKVNLASKNTCSLFSFLLHRMEKKVSYSNTLIGRKSGHIIKAPF